MEEAASTVARIERDAGAHGDEKELKASFDRLEALPNLPASLRAGLQEEHARLRERLSLHRRGRLRTELRKRRQALHALVEDKRDKIVKKLGTYQRVVDKVVFCAGVIFLCLTEFILVHSPSRFYIWYLLTLAPLMALRYINYHPQKWHYFMLDFCYFVQVLLLFNIFCMPRSPLLFQTVFVSINGPLGMAIPTWRNSLVFHDIDKITSMFIHAFPPLVTFSLRWFTPEGFVVEETPGAWLSFSAAIVYPVVAYAGWQLLYWLKTDVMDGSKLESDPELQTSFRWLTSDTRTYVGRTCAKYAKRGRGAVLIMYMWLQFAYTFLCMLPGFLLFRYFWLHLLYLLSVLIWGTYNGANYYFVKFTREYEATLQATLQAGKEERAREAQAVSEGGPAVLGENQADGSTAATGYESDGESDRQGAEDVGEPERQPMKARPAHLIKRPAAAASKAG